MRALALVLAVAAYPALAEPYRPLPRYTPEKVRQRVAGSHAAQRVHSQAPVVPVAATASAAPAVAEDPVHVIAIPPQPEPPRPANRAHPGSSPSPTPIVAASAAKPAPAAPPRGPMEEGAEIAAAPEPSPAAPAVIAPAAALPAPAKLADLKVTVGQAGADGGFVMLVEDPSGGARIELTLDGGGRLLSVRRAGAL